MQSSLALIPTCMFRLCLQVQGSAFLTRGHITNASAQAFRGDFIAETVEHYMIPLRFCSHAKIGNFKKGKSRLSPGQALRFQLTQSSQMQALILLCQCTHLLRSLRGPGGCLAGGTVPQDRCGLRREAVERGAEIQHILYRSFGNFWTCNLALIVGKRNNSQPSQQNDIRSLALVGNSGYSR